MSFNINNTDIRGTYTTAVKMFAKANNVPVDKVDVSQLTQGYLLTMCDINPNQSILQFPIVDTQQVSGAPINPLMRLLSMQDSFVVGSMDFYLLKYSFTGTQASPDFSSGDSFFTPITFVDQFHDNNTVTFPILNHGIGIFWRGYISIEVDKKVLIPYWDTMRHYYAPMQQAVNWPGPGSAPGTTAYPVYQSQYDGSTDGYYPVEPTIVLGGGRQNIVKLNLPANIPNVNPFTYAGYGTTFIMKANITFRGILAQNSTAVR